MSDGGYGGSDYCVLELVMRLILRTPVLNPGGTLSRLICKQRLQIQKRPPSRWLTKNRTEPKRTISVRLFRSETLGNASFSKAARCVMEFVHFSELWKCPERSIWTISKSIPGNELFWYWLSVWWWFWCDSAWQENINVPYRVLDLLDLDVEIYWVDEAQ